MSVPRRAVVLAAGRGARLGAHTASTPKSLMSLDDTAHGGTTLLGRQLAQLQRCGVRRVTVVAGYLDEQLHRFVAAWNDDGDGRLRARCVVNPRWAVSGSAASLLCAADELLAGEPLLLSHGDIVYDDAILDAMLAARGTAVAADGDWRRVSGDEVLAWERDGRLAGVLKGQPPAGCGAVGEFVGLSLVGPGFAAEFVGFCRARLAHSPGDNYEQPLLNDFVAKGARCSVVFCEPQRWINVNDAEDLRRARNEFAASVSHDRCPKP